MTKQALLEPSFADAIRAVEQAAELLPQQRAQWCSALRQIAKAIGQPMATLPARSTAARFNIERLHPAVVGANPKTLANQKSNVKAALRWFGKEHDVAPRGVPLTAEWAALRDSIGDYGRKARLSGFMRYCSGRNIEPGAVNEAALDDYFAYRKQTTSLATNPAARRSVARTWNACVNNTLDWPPQRFAEPQLQALEGPAWSDFPEGLRRDVDGYLAGLQQIRKGSNGRRYRPCSPKTIKTRRAELVAFARKAISSVTTYGSIYKLRRASQLLDPNADFGWLTELDKDLALVMQPRSKVDRFVLSEVLVECGLTLMAEADGTDTLSTLAKARQFRNGLMVAMLALHPIRLKNFAHLEIGHDIVEIDDQWWIVLSSAATKEARPDERRIYVRSAATEPCSI